MEDEKGESPYDLLGLGKECGPEELGRAYRRRALQWHPDKHGPETQAAAAEQFARLTEAYRLLADPERRKAYDRTGCWEQADEPVDYSAIYREVSQQDLADFEAAYRNSAEEAYDVQRVYTIFRGDMNKILETIMCSTAADGPRFAKILSEAHEAGKLAFFPKFARTTTAAAHKKRLKAETDEGAQLGANSFAELASSINARRQGRASSMESLIARIEASAKPKGRKRLK